MTATTEAPDATAEPASPSPTGARWTVLTVVLAGALMAVIDVAIVNVAIPSISAELRADYSLVELVISAYTVTYASLLVTGGRLGDAYGRKRMFLLGLAVFTAASAACGLAPSIWLLIAARAAQGVGGALLYPQVLAIIQVTYTGGQRPRALGIFGSVIGVGAIAGQLLGGLLLAADVLGLGWRPVFLVNVPLGIAAIAAAVRLLPPDGPPSRTRLDRGGLVLVPVTLVALIVPLLRGRDAGWPLWMILSLLAFPVLVFVFLRYERRMAARGGDPLVRLDLFRQRGFAVGVPIAVLFAASYAGFLLLLALYLQVGLGFSPLRAALVYTPNAVGFFVASLFAAPAARLLGRHVLALGYGLGALGLLCTAATAAASGSRLAGWEFAPPLLLAGLGLGLGMTPLIGTILGTLAPSDAGAGAGTVTTTLQVGNALGVALHSVLFFGLLGLGEASRTTPADFARAYALTVPVTALLLVAAVILALRLPATDGSAGNRLLEHVPGRLAGLSYSLYLMTGGRLGDRAFQRLLGHEIDRRRERSAEAPAELGPYLAYHFAEAGRNRAWLAYLEREALTHPGTVPHEERRRPVIEAQIAEIRARQDSGDLPAGIDPGMVRLLVFALANYPYLLPQITRMATGRDPDDPDFAEEWSALLRRVGARISAP